MPGIILYNPLTYLARGRVIMNEDYLFLCVSSTTEEVKTHATSKHRSSNCHPPDQSSGVPERSLVVTHKVPASSGVPMRQTCLVEASEQFAQVRQRGRGGMDGLLQHSSRLPPNFDQRAHQSSPTRPNKLKKTKTKQNELGMNK